MSQTQNREVGSSRAQRVHRQTSSHFVKSTSQYSECDPVEVAETASNVKDRGFFFLLLFSYSDLSFRRVSPCVSSSGRVSSMCLSGSGPCSGPTPPSPFNPARVQSVPVLHCTPYIHRVTDMHLLLSDELRCDGGGRVEKVEGKGGCYCTATRSRHCIDVRAPC